MQPPQTVTLTQRENALYQAGINAGEANALGHAAKQVRAAAKAMDQLATELEQQANVQHQLSQTKIAEATLPKNPAPSPAAKAGAGLAARLRGAIKALVD